MKIDCNKTPEGGRMVNVFYNMKRTTDDSSTFGAVLTCTDEIPIENNILNIHTNGNEVIYIELM